MEQVKKACSTCWGAFAIGLVIGVIIEVLIYGI